ncbi:MAG TPA: 16S rRNA (guanine(966)-N(2))-methyltransferase RsmD, partial [Micromonosporaceae bacterium]|nr:16S rRNA (guanine(966)-N(2))-methyltransferase RsmD [Micromonosporaceae bacterium]
MTRIVSGRYGGRRISVPEGRHTRPTSDRVREALFSTLDSQMDLAGARVLDLFAGSGAVGLEALSRGAEHALLVEHDPKAVKAIRANIAALAAT